MSTNKSNPLTDKLLKLEIFKGTWRIKGENISSDTTTPNTPVEGNEFYEWLDGNHFLVSNWQHLTTEGGHKGISIVGYNNETQDYYSQNFDNLGFERKYKLNVSGRDWNFLGDKERATRTFSDDHSSFTEFWEQLNDKNEWITLCRLEGRRDF